MKKLCYILLLLLVFNFDSFGQKSNYELITSSIEIKSLFNPDEIVVKTDIYLNIKSGKGLPIDISLPIEKVKNIDKYKFIDINHSEINFKNIDVNGQNVLKADSIKIINGSMEIYGLDLNEQLKSLKLAKKAYSNHNEKEKIEANIYLNLDFICPSDDANNETNLRNQIPLFLSGKIETENRIYKNCNLLIRKKVETFNQVDFRIDNDIIGTHFIQDVKLVKDNGKIYFQLAGNHERIYSIKGDKFDGFYDMKSDQFVCYFNLKDKKGKVQRYLFINQ